VRTAAVRRAVRTALAALACASLVTACASKRVEPPKPPTETTVRAKFTAEQTAKALGAIRDLQLRESLERHLVERGRSARGQGLRFAVERVEQGETMHIGAGMQLVRTFVLYHEYDDRRFTTWIEGIETVGGNVRAAFRAQAGGSGRGIAEIAAVELNRAVVDLHEFDKGDAPCCPTRRNQAMYTLTGFSLEVAKNP
jgi:hypothetical protein